MTFGGIPIEFDGRVLRPRPWTQEQSRWGADLLRTVPPGPVLEVCAGVGHIGLLAVEGSGRDLVQVDLDPVACGFARRNARGAAGHVDVRQGEMRAAVAAGEMFALVIADPPWVPSSATVDFPLDPLLAIDGGADGMGVAWSCLEVAAEHLLAGGSALLQLGTTAQADLVRDHLADRPQLGLRRDEVREHGDRGVLVRLVRS